MTNEEFEDAMAKAIINGDVELIPVPEDQIGNYRIDSKYYYNEMYEMYKDSCHSSEALSAKQSYEKKVDPSGLDENRFACRGRFGYFRWYALTVYYDENIHKMDDEKRNYNLHHSLTACERFIGEPSERFCTAINNDNELCNILRDPIVANLVGEKLEEEMLGMDFESMYDMKSRLEHFIGKPFGEDIFDYEQEVISDLTEKDVIIPMVYANNENLRFFGELSMKVIEAGANTVVGLFATRVVPAPDGRELKNIEDIPEEYLVASFAPTIRLPLDALMNAKPIDNLEEFLKKKR